MSTIENYCIDCKSVAQPDCDARGHIVGTLGQSSDESPASRAGDSKQSKLFSRYTFAVVTGRYKILDNRSEGPTRITQIATADGEDEARLIIQALNQHATLIEQRERLLRLLRPVTSPTACYCTQCGTSLTNRE